MKIIKEFPASEPIVAMTQFKNTVLVATRRSLYRMVDEKMMQVEFVVLEPDPQDIDEEEIPF